MIGYIKGKVIFSDGQQSIVLTSQGLGYEVQLHRMLHEGQEIELFISHIFKENSQELYAFIEHGEKTIFETLLKVKGVGSKSAFAIIRHLGPVQTLQAIRIEDKKVLQSVPGIGPKAAAQIILDLKSKVEAVAASLSSEFQWGKTSTSDKQSIPLKMDPVLNSAIVQDTLLACRELGFKEAHVIQVIRDLTEEEEFKSSEQMVQKVLKNLAAHSR